MPLEDQEQSLNAVIIAVDFINTKQIKQIPVTVRWNSTDLSYSVIYDYLELVGTDTGLAEVE